MKSDVFILLRKLTLLLLIINYSVFAESDYQVSPNEDSMYEIEMMWQSDKDIEVVNTQALSQKTEDGIHYLRISYTLMNNAELTLPAHEWAINIGDERISGIEESDVKAGASRVFSRLVFGGIVQSGDFAPELVVSKHSSQTSLNIAYKNASSGKQCSDQGQSLLSCAIAMVGLEKFCPGYCYSEGAHGSSPSCFVGRDNKTNCPILVTDCGCIGRSAGLDDYSLPEISRNPSIYESTQDVMRNHSPLQSRPFENQ